MSLNKNNYPIPKEIESIIDRFAGFTDIPRPSGNEEAIRNRVLSFTPKNGARIERKVDARGNVALNMPAAPGCEGLPLLIVQGHMDMVTNGNEDSPTHAYIDAEGWMHAEGTTLGADNGIGVALALETLDALPERHGPVTALLTVHEEAMPMGATKLDSTIIPAHDEAVLLNLDAEEGPTHICKGCAAAADITATFRLGERVPIGDGDTALTLTLGDLPSGHSGVDIHRGRGNAIRIMAALLTALGEQTALRLIALDGGVRRNVIPSTATATIAVPAADREAVQKTVEQFVRDTRQHGMPAAELAAEHAGDLTIATASATPERGALTQQDTQTLLTALTSVAAGVLEQVDGEPHGGVRLSNNIAQITTAEDAITLDMLARGAERSRLVPRMEAIKETLLKRGASSVETSNAEGDWLEPDDSRAVALAVRAAEQSTGKTPSVFAYHAGLECAHIIERLEGRIPRRSAVAIGPITKEAHTVNEHMYVPSIAETARFIAAFTRLLWE